MPRPLPAATIRTQVSVPLEFADGYSATARVFSFDWLSFGNDDMTTYLLGGNHFFAHGYFQLPSVAELVGERDPSWNTSFFYSFDEVRYASPLMLAWVMSVAGLSSGARGSLT